MHRWAMAGVVAALGCGTGTVLLSDVSPAAPAHASSPGAAVTVSPSRSLTGGQLVTVSGKGFPKSGGGTNVTWFVAQCTAAVHGRLNASSDASHCDLTSAKVLHIGKNGIFTAHYRIETGVVGDGYCGTAGHLTCVVGVGTADSTGFAVKVTFRNPPPYPGSAPAPSPPSTPTT